MEKVTVLEKMPGRVLPLHGVNCAPYQSMAGAQQPLIRQLFSQAKIPYCRLHDVMGAYGGCYFVDIPNIFPDFEKDETDPENYDFYYTDEYLAPIVASGTQIVYRLGITIEWGSKKYRANPPTDAAKWARICEHIIAHYNEGWKNGFHYDISYWEIWNEPENPPMWTGTKEQFFDLYRTASLHLKAVYPQLKIGGYGSCGFYAVTDPNADAFLKSFVPYFTDFLRFCRQENCPLDFFSWHIYTDSPDMLMQHAAYVRRTLDEYGFSTTESHLNEWNYGRESHGFSDKHTDVGASFLAACLMEMQHSGLVDKAMYYVFSAQGMYNGFMNQNDHSLDAPYWIFTAFGDLYQKGDLLKTECTSGIRALAAQNDTEGGLLLTNYTAQPVEVQLNCAKTLYRCALDETLPCEPGLAVTQPSLTLPAYGSAYFKLR